MQEPEAEVITALLDIPAHRFADPVATEAPTSGAGIYDCGPPRLNAGPGPSRGQQAGY